MVRYHYALVDDLISREEFDRRIEEKITACGHLADETAAALLVVKDLGRSHVKIRGLSGKSSLFCFYAKILAYSGVKEFERASGDKGLVNRLTVADETGQVDLVFWDEQAAALEDTFTIGEVVEVIGRHGRSGREIQPLNLRTTPIEISCGMEVIERKVPERRDLHLLLITVQPPRTFTRRDGTSGEMIVGLCGDQNGTARLLCWEPLLLDGVSLPQAVQATGILEKEGDYGGREILFDDQTQVTLAETAPEIPTKPLGEVLPDQTISVSGTLVKVMPAKEFTKRDGNCSWVRNCLIQDESGKLPLVIWDEDARRPLLMGDRVVLHHVQSRINRTGDTEISLGKGASLLIQPEDGGVPLTFTGTILHLPEGTFIDDGLTSYLVASDLPHGMVAEIRGIQSSRRLFFESEEIQSITAGSVKEALCEFLSSLSKV